MGIICGEPLRRVSATLGGSRPKGAKKILLSFRRKRQVRPGKGVPVRIRGWPGLDGGKGPWPDAERGPAGGDMFCRRILYPQVSSFARQAPQCVCPVRTRAETARLSNQLGGLGDCLTNWVRKHPNWLALTEGSTRGRSATSDRPCVCCCGDCGPVQVMLHGGRSSVLCSGAATHIRL